MGLVVTPVACSFVFDSYSHVSINLSNDIFEPMWQFACFELSQNYITVYKSHFGIYNYKLECKILQKSL